MGRVNSLYRGRGSWIGSVRILWHSTHSLAQYASVGTVLSRCSLDDFDQAFSCKSELWVITRAVITTGRGRRGRRNLNSPSPPRSTKPRLSRAAVGRRRRVSPHRTRSCWRQSCFCELTLIRKKLIRLRRSYLL